MQAFATTPGLCGGTKTLLQTEISDTLFILTFLLFIPCLPIGAMRKTVYLLTHLCLCLFMGLSDMAISMKMEYHREQCVMEGKLLGKYSSVPLLVLLS